MLFGSDVTGWEVLPTKDVNLPFKINHSQFCGFAAAVVAGFSACFEEEFGFEDAHGFGDGFAHVVEGEGGAAGSGEGFHLDAGAGGGDAGAGDGDGVFACGIGFDLYLAVFERDRVAEGDEVGGFFCGHGAGDDGGVKDGAFFALDIAIGEQRHDIGAYFDEALGGGDAAGAVFLGDVNHSWLVVFVDVGEFGHGDWKVEVLFLNAKECEMCETWGECLG